MIHSIKGKIIGSSERFLILDIGPLSLKVFSPKNTLKKFAAQAKPVELLTYFHIGENNVALYGFETQKELELFELLTSVPGIGPASAISILGESQTDSIFEAISQGNKEFLAKIVGIGPKKAQRIIAELQGSLKIKTPSKNLKEILEIEAALTSLGYKRTEIKEALLKIDLEKDFEENLKLCLRFLANQ